jgi:GNAT superfamily N-acetyltransferase
MSSAAIQLVDLDQRPDLLPAVISLFQSASNGAQHHVCGVARYMGLPVSADIFSETAGTLIALHNKKPIAVLAICPYSDEQITLWGPVVATGVSNSVTDVLVQAGRDALQLSRYGSMRSLVDTRNRPQRTILQNHGFTSWKDTLVYERRLDANLRTQTTAVRLATARELSRLATLFIQGFPDSDHCLPNLERRESEGFRHYLLEKNGVCIAAAAIQPAGNRAWLKLITIAESQRGKGIGHEFLQGICSEEAKRYSSVIGLEVLVENTAANALYSKNNFKKKFTATIMTAPV